MKKLTLTSVFLTIALSVSAVTFSGIASTNITGAVTGSSSYVIVDTNNDGLAFDGSVAGDTFTLNSFVGTSDDYVIGYNAVASSFAVSILSGRANFTLDTNGVSANDAFYIVTFGSETTASVTAIAGLGFNVFTAENWLVPGANGDVLTYPANFTQFDSQNLTAQTVAVSEPFTIAALAGLQIEYEWNDGTSSVPGQELYGSDGYVQYGFSGSLLERTSYTYAQGVITYTDWGEEIRLTFSSATSGTFEYYEVDYPTPDGGPNVIGTFTVVTPNLVLKNDWQRTETMNSPLSTDYWNVWRRTVDSVAYNAGALNFLFAGGGDSANYNYDYPEIEIEYGRTLPMDENWQVVLNDAYANSSLDDFELEMEFELEAAGYVFDFEFEFEHNSYAGRDVSISIYTGSDYGYASESVIAGDLVSLRVRHNAELRELLFEYQPDSATEWRELARLDLANGGFSGVNSSGGGFSGELVNPTQRMVLDFEVEAGVATQIGDLTIGGIEITVPLELVESKGNTALLKNENGYFIGDESRSLKYEGAQLGEIPGWTYLGVESDESTGYHMMIRNDGTGEYVRWTLDSSGNITVGDYLSVREVQVLEPRFDQDLDGDEEIGVQPASVIESYGQVSLLYDDYGYYIGDESRSLKYEGAQLGNIPGWTYLGVESDGSTGYHVMIRNDGTGEFVRWTLDSSGNIIGGDYLSIRDVQVLEPRFDQDLDGDEEIGVQPASVIESYGQVSLLYDDYGYYIGDESRSLKYEGAQLGNIPGWTYLGVESDGSTGYHVMIRNDGTGEYVRWTLDSSGNIIGGDYLSVRDVQVLEPRFDQDLDGDEEIGVQPASVIESYGQVSLLYDAGYGYYIGDESRSLKYEGAQLGNIPGWTYLGVESDESTGYHVMIRNDGTGEYVRWTLDSSGNIIGGDYLSVRDVQALEPRFDQDLNGDEEIGLPPTLAPYTIEPGTVAKSEDTITFIGSNNDYTEFDIYGYYGISAGTYSYSHIDETRAAFYDNGGDYVDVGGVGQYPAESYTLNFTSETALTRSSDGTAYELYPSSDLAPTSLAGLTAATDGYVYSNVEGGYSESIDLVFSNASSGTYYGNLTLPFNYTYLKVGPREGRLNAIANDTIYGSVNVSYIFYFETASSGYIAGTEQFSNGVVEYQWGTFSLN